MPTLLDDNGIAHEIVERTANPERLYLVAIPNGGIPLACRQSAKAPRDYFLAEL